MVTSMPRSNGETYNLGFRTVSLRPQLARIIAESYLTVGNWSEARDRVVATNALQCRTTGGTERQEREIRRRLMRLTRDQITILAAATADDRAAMAWLAALKDIRFAFDFAAEALREKLAAHDPILRPSDYEAYEDVKSSMHPELAQLSPPSKRKIRQVLLRMLREAGLLGPGTALGTIQRPVLSPSVLKAIKADSPYWLAGFLVSDTEIGGM